MNESALNLEDELRKIVDNAWKPILKAHKEARNELKKTDAIVSSCIRELKTYGIEAVDLKIECRPDNDLVYWILNGEFLIPPRLDCLNALGSFCLAFGFETTRLLDGKIAADPYTSKEARTWRITNAKILWLSSPF